MATPEELAQAIGCLGVTFPKFVEHEIAHLSDEFVASVKSFQNPFAQVGDLSVQSLVADVAKLAQGDVMGDVAQVAGIVAPLATAELSVMVPGSASASSGNRVQDVLNLGASVAGQAMLAFGLIPETPFVIAQRLCETIDQLCTIKLQNLACLSKHIIQLSNVMTVLVQTRGTLGALAADLQTVETELATAQAEFLRSRRISGPSPGLDVNAFDRGRAALERALTALMPKLPDAHQGILEVASALAAAAPLPAPLVTSANSRLAITVVTQLVDLVRKESQAIDVQTQAIRFHILQLRAVVTNYRGTPAQAAAIAMRLQTVATLLSKLQDLQASVHAARVQQGAHASAPQLLGWAVRIRSILALAGSIRAEELVESARDLVVDAVLKNTYGALLAVLDQINSAHVRAALDDVSDLVGSCQGIARQAELLLERIESVAVKDSDLATFQVLVANTAVKLGGRIEESSRATAEIALACVPMIALSIAARVTIDKLVSSMEQLGLDRGRDLLVSGQFGALVSANVDDLSYLGSTIACLTDVMAGIDDAGLRRKISAIRDDLIGRKTNSLLAAADNMDFAGLRRTAAIKDDLATLEQNAATVQSILSYLQGLASSVSIDSSALDPLNHAEFLADVDYLTVNAGGRLATTVAELIRPAAGLPAC